MRVVFAILFSLVLAPAIKPASGQANAPVSPGRVALVIGNANYQDADSPLKDPVKDVRAMANELLRMGFDVDVGENLSKDAMRRAFDRLNGKIKPGSIALVFFSGHAIQANRQNYMLPTDAHVWTEAEVRREGVGLDDVLAQMNERGATTGLVILDASRRNPFERRYRLTPAGLAPLNAPRGSLVFYSTAPGNLTDDATAGTFASELISQLRAPDLTAEEVFNRTSLAVSRASAGEQVPWFSSSLSEDFSFGPRPAAAAAPTPVAPQPPIAASDDNKQVVAAKPEAPSIGPNFAGKPPNASGNTPGSEVARVDPRPDVVKPPPIPDRPSIDPADDALIKNLDVQLQHNPRDAVAFYKRGQLYARNRDYSRAAADFDAAIQLNPKDAEAFNNRCWARAMFTDLQIALKDCNEALRLQPRYADALDSRGLVHLKLDMIQEAVADYDAALRIKSNQASALYGRGIGKLRMGKTAEGNSDIATAKTINTGIAEEFAGYGIRQ
jgi:regulator of sirC expression with transglutaminase-like and TPR domain